MKVGDNRNHLSCQHNGKEELGASETHLISHLLGARASLVALLLGGQPNVHKIAT